MNLHNLHVLSEITNLFFDEKALIQRTQSPPMNFGRESVQPRERKRGERL